MKRKNSKTDAHPVKQGISLILCTTPRSGSSYLSKGIELTKTMGTPAEWLHPIALGETRRALDVGPSAPMDAILKGVAERFTASNGVFALKLMWTQLVNVINAVRVENPAIIGLSGVELLARYFPNPHFVLLTRQNLIAQAISYSRAILSNRWLDYGQSPDPSEPSEHAFNFYLLSGRLESLRRENRNWQQFLAVGERPVLELVYEQIVRDYRGSLESIAAFLGIDRELPVDLAKNRYRKMRDATSARWAREYRETCARIEAAEREDAIAKNPPEAFAAEITPLEYPESVQRSGVFQVSVQIRNASEHTWRSVGKKDGTLWNSVTSRWYQGCEEMIVIYQFFTPLPRELAPNASARISLFINAPDQPGAYRLEVCFAQTGVCFSGEPAVLSVEVGHLPSESEALRYFEEDAIDPEGWIWIEWLGSLWVRKFPWVYSTRYGWLCCRDHEQDPDGYWFYRKDLGWFWTSPEAAPDVWSADRKEWLRGELKGRDRERFITPGPVR